MKRILKHIRIWRHHCSLRTKELIWNSSRSLESSRVKHRVRSIHEISVHIGVPTSKKLVLYLILWRKEILVYVTFRVLYRHSTWWESALTLTHHRFGVNKLFSICSWTFLRKLIGNTRLTARTFPLFKLVFISIPFLVNGLNIESEVLFDHLGVGWLCFYFCSLVNRTFFFLFFI